MKKTSLLMLMAIFFVGFQSCQKDDDDDMTSTPSPPAKMSSTYNYEFNNGQVVAAAAYDGTHSDELTATIKVEENTSTTSTITVTLTNTVNGATYNVHAHDAADPATTPNGTPYNESPNGSVFAQSVTGNGGTVTLSQTASMSYSDITTVYDGFFVVHDPLQAINTADISTYLVVGSFARSQTPTNYSNMTFSYSFNTGQLDTSYAYSGSHATDLSATLKVQELADGTSRITVMLDNTISGQTYPVHAHDAADPATTPNGTPYNESPNGNVCAVAITGNGGAAMASQNSSLSYSNITSTYSGFFVVHDPLQAVNTADPTTYVILGQFARN